MSEHLEPWLPGTPCWVDLTAPDPEVADDLLLGPVRLAGRADSAADFGLYRVARQGGRRVAGIGSPPPDQPMPAAWTTYLATADADATAAAITAAGGTVLFAPIDVADAGPDVPRGRPDRSRRSGSGRAGATPVRAGQRAGLVHLERVHVDRLRGGQGLLRHRLRLRLVRHEWRGLQLRLVRGRRPRGRRLGALPADAPRRSPSHWMAYFKVADADASAAKVTELGGTVQREPWDTPFGRMVIVSDDQGAAFSLMADTEESHRQRRGPAASGGLAGPARLGRWTACRSRCPRPTRRTPSGRWTAATGRRSRRSSTTSPSRRSTASGSGSRWPGCSTWSTTRWCPASARSPRPSAARCRRWSTTSGRSRCASSRRTSGRPPTT